MTDWLIEPVNPIKPNDIEQAQAHQDDLTKPKGSLGQLESLAIQIAALQQRQSISVERSQVIIFAGDHGIAEENVSAFPQSVSAEMVKNFSAGGAAISVLAKQHQLPLQVINLALASELTSLPLVETQHIAPGTKNFLHQPAMTQGQLNTVFEVAKKKVEQLKSSSCELLILGEMGIANTTSATALLCALKSIDPEEVTGAGTGLNAQGIAHKINIIRRSLKQHQRQLTTPLKILQILGGFEIAALTGSYIRCAQQGIIVLVDGFICSVAALFAIEINNQCKHWLIFSHRSAEYGHQKVLEYIAAKPLLDLNLRLGEASGAALAYPIIRSACLLHNKMASFSSAGVTQKNN